jgi:hypothetical protein
MTLTLLYIDVIVLTNLQINFVFLFYMETNKNGKILKWMGVTVKEETTNILLLCLARKIGTRFPKHMCIDSF